MAKGHILLPRQMVHDALWTRTPFSEAHAWVDLVLRAEPVDTTVSRSGATVPVQRGQLFTSQAALARRWGWGRHAVIRYLGALKTDGSVHITSHIGSHIGPNSGYTIVTILNYEQYCHVTTSDRTSDRTSPGPSDRTQKLGTTETKSISVVVSAERQEADPSTQERIALEAKAMKERFMVAAARVQP